MTWQENGTWQENSTGHVPVRCQFIGPAGGWMWASCGIVTYSTEQGPSLEANRFSAIQKSPAFYDTWRFITAYKKERSNCPIFLVGSHQSILPSHFPEIHLLIIPPSTPGSSRWFLSFRSPYPNPVRTSALLHTWFMPRHSHSSLFYHPNNIRRGVGYISLSSSLCSSRTCNNVEFCEQWRTEFRIHGDPDMRRV